MKKSRIALLATLGAILVVLLAFVVLTALTVRRDLTGGGGLSAERTGPVAGRAWVRAEDTRFVEGPIHTVGPM